ncbi:MAG: redoxin domain-containing protein [Flavisolibacter sp.]|nr:redoxin domain-containing protein [Flavisolibacter sp.]
MYRLLLFFFMQVSLVSWSQTATPKSLPAFRILQPNGTFFTSENLTKGKPTVIIYFAPECDHCQTLMNAYFKRVTDFNKAQVVMVTFKPVQELTPFINHYNVAKYPNIIVGTEGTTFYLRYYYNIANTPFVALYDRSGQLVYAYRKIDSVDDLISRLKAIR